MQKQGEIILIENHIATVRVYKNDEPSSLTLRARVGEGFCVADFVNVDLNSFVFIFSVLFAYLFPFVISGITYLIASFFTDNIGIIQALFLSSLVASYILAVKLEKTKLFKGMSAGEITDYAE